MINNLLYFIDEQICNNKSLKNFTNSEQKKYFANFYNSNDTNSRRSLEQTEIDTNCNKIMNDINKCKQQFNGGSFELKNKQFEHFGFFKLTQCKNLPSFKFGIMYNKLNKTDYLTFVNLVSNEWLIKNYSIKYDGNILEIKIE